MKHLSKRGRFAHARDGVLHRRLLDEVVILDLEGLCYYGLKGSAAFIWETLIEGEAIDTLPDQISDRYDLPANRAATDLDAFLRELSAANLIRLTDTRESRVLRSA